MRLRVVHLRCHSVALGYVNAENITLCRRVVTDFSTFPDILTLLRFLRVIHSALIPGTKFMPGSDVNPQHSSTSLSAYFYGVQ